MQMHVTALSLNIDVLSILEHSHVGVTLTYLEYFVRILNITELYDPRVDSWEMASDQIYQLPLDH
eukprot:scaffold743_cov145-Skeletonema_menzelii.AAC.2